MEQDNPAFELKLLYLKISEGLIGIILQWLTALVFVPTISLIGLSLFEEAASTASKNWGIAFITILLLVLFSKYLKNIYIPGCSYSRERGWKIEKLPVLKLFPVILTVVSAWVICFILTAADALGPTNSARTDFCNHGLDFFILDSGVNQQSPSVLFLECFQEY
ncbi:solute carrier family 23 member 2-like [Tachypleus tridentatus]|uniref:solute carrier family 23 member 2-like n=1 Tax=Tachypleus tridentatus TaxID=6853 RepID=UPI003FCFD5C4